MSDTRVVRDYRVVTIAVSILVAGLLIAGAILLSNGGTPAAPAAPAVTIAPASGSSLEDAFVEDGVCRDYLYGSEDTDPDC